MWSTDINLLAVLACGIASMIVGGMWYSPILFGKSYMKLMKVDNLSAKEMAEMQKTMGPSYGLMFVGSLIMAYILAIFLGVFQADTLQMATNVAFWAWLGFMAPVCLGMSLFGNLKGNDRWTLLAINAGNYFVTIMIMATILSLWK